ncbi:hypothetical protein RND81_02G245200 [Saponaria officinalis]|uniref:Uncharacterized protein n=1 Tax=Saponaria officinalis TaxID=3572 RepID=A0AAW1MWW2_SAPOF
MSFRDIVPKNFKLFLGLICCFSILGLVVCHETRNPNVFPAIFNFGDSNSDTGSFSAVFNPVLYPNGMTFFGHPSGRSCDGRLIIDFLAEKLSLPHLSSYLDAMEANFRHGANFATCGTTIVPVDGNLYEHGATPIPLNLQVVYFQQFKQRAIELYNREKLENRLPKPEEFSKALYTIDMGQNDINLLITMSREQAHKSLHHIIDSLGLAIVELYQLGARSFLIHNTGPYGCLPMFIPKNRFNLQNLDEIGCVKSYNEIAQEFNKLLKEKVSMLQIKLEDSSLVYVDIYSAKYSLFRDAKLHGNKSSYSFLSCVILRITISLP